MRVPNTSCPKELFDFSTTIAPRFNTNITPLDPSALLITLLTLSDVQTSEFDEIHAAG